jgi:GntR family transcriptional regulator
MSVPLSRAHLALERIRELVASGTQGDRLPSEAELSAQIGVSRVTVRDALSTLWHEGAIVRRWGVGTYIADQSANSSPGRFRSYYVDSHTIGSLPAQIQQAGHSVGLSAFRVDCPSPPAWIRKEAITMGPLVRILRCITIDRQPALIMEDYIPSRLNDREVAAEDLQDLSMDLTSFLRQLGLRVVKHEGTLSAVLADDETAALLEVELGSALLTSHQRAIDDSGTVVACSQLLYRSDVLAQILVRTVAE